MRPLVLIGRRSYWIPGSYAPAVSAKGSSFSRPLKKKDFTKERAHANGLSGSPRDLGCGVQLAL
jgi:hypothetical protein